jgi:hypothetical protein
MNRQTSRYTEGQVKDRQADRQIGSQSDKTTGRLTGKRIVRVKEQMDRPAASKQMDRQTN